jgi:MraZ protein
MPGFYGNYMHTLDAKNRVFVPAKLRSELGETFYVTRKLTKKALAVYSPEGWEKLQKKLSEHPDTKVGNLKMFLFSHSISATPDGQGRILLPPDLTEYAGITKEVTFVGVGDHLLIYAADVWRAEEAEQAKIANMEEMCLLMGEIGL